MDKQTKTTSISILRIQHAIRQIEDIYFFEVIKHISSIVLKTSELSRVHSTSENFDYFNS